MRKLTRFTLPFAGAMALCQYVLPPPWRLWCAVAALLAALTAAMMGERLRVVLLPSLLGLSLGLVWYSGWAAWAYAPAGELADTEGTAEFVVESRPERTAYGWRCTVRLEGGRGRAVYYSDGDMSPWDPGDRFIAPVRYADAGDNSYYASRKIFLRLYDRGEAELVEKGKAGDPRYLPQRLARRLRGAVETVYGDPERGLILALLTGEREALDEQSLGDLEEAGLLHITAVSGLHCGMLLSVLGCVLLRRRRLTAFVGYPVLLLYAVMVGATPSVVRACVMSGFLLLADLVDREADPLTALSGAAVVILLANPFAISSYSFQLSFASVAGLLVASPRLYRLLGGALAGEERTSWLRRAWDLLAGTLSASLGAMVFTAPLSALYFNFLPLLSVVSNLLVLWMLPPLFVGALALTPLAAAAPALAPLAGLPALLARYVLWAAGLVAHLPGHAVYFTGLTAVFWLVYVYAMAVLCAVSRDRPRKYAVAAVLAAVALAAAVDLPGRAVRDDAMTAVAVDVGQGACTILSSEGETVLVDCGSVSSGQGAGCSAADTLASYGWRRLKAVVLTHYHTDHAGGLAQLLARVPVERLYLPQLGENNGQWELQGEVLALAERYGVSVSFVEAAATVALGGARLTLYPPLTSGDVNEEGLTALCTVGDFDLLITGDMASSTEKLLVEAYELPEVEVLMVGHHGSKYASSQELLREIAPQVGVISVGENSYGHPTAEAMDRCVKAGMELYRTDLQGNILIRVRR